MLKDREGRGDSSGGGCVKNDGLWWMGGGWEGVCFVLLLLLLDVSVREEELSLPRAAGIGEKLLMPRKVVLGGRPIAVGGEREWMT